MYLLFLLRIIINESLGVESDKLPNEVHGVPVEVNGVNTVVAMSEDVLAADVMVNKISINTKWLSCFRNYDFLEKMAKYSNIFGIYSPIF